MNSVFIRTNRTPMSGILKVSEHQESCSDLENLNWDDEQAVKYQVAINCLHNYAVGKTISEMPNTSIRSIRKEKSLKFAEQIEIEINFQRQSSTFDTSDSLSPRLQV